MFVMVSHSPRAVGVDLGGAGSSYAEEERSKTTCEKEPIGVDRMMPDTSSAPRGTTVKIFLADGTPDGLRVVEKSNWTGIALMCARVQYADVRKRSEFDRPCIYLLTGPSEEIIDRQQIYIGQSDIGRSRIDNHADNKDFWTHLILFTSKDSNLNRAHVQYLESRLIQLAKQSKRADLTNGNVPNAPFLSEADIADMESFLADMLTIYPLLGVTAFEQVQPASNQGDGTAALPTDESSPLLHLSGPKAHGAGRDTPSGFVVYKGSEGRIETMSGMQPWGHALREALIAEGTILKTDEALFFQADYVFRSPTAAAVVLLGRNANGRTEWKDDNGKTLKSLQDAKLAASKISDVAAE